MKKSRATSRLLALAYISELQYEYALGVEICIESDMEDYHQINTKFKHDEYMMSCMNDIYRRQSNISELWHVRYMRHI